ncbi:transposase [Nonomuraea jiangxiensis]|uniref:Transposase DDE domain-containing protein n=1 Tax=Nonomuraea jiangxiensis TaxID=633440 RepID=A0A1G8M7W2_9ACTN|nr:transposase [Nonomuraea jiangxiensis]SDI64001.1 Transposase DDE domain-containing protein [Nonomuraea jiangxiensis]
MADRPPHRPDRIIPTIDPEARHIHKSGRQRDDGYKVHLAVEPETGLFTAVALRPGAGAAHHETAVAPDLLAAERGPLQILADAAYAAAWLRATLTDAGHRLLIKPPALKPAVAGGFTLDDFIIDTGAGTVTCPAAHTVPLAAPAGHYQQRRATFTGLCAACPLRDRCTTAKTGRIVTIRPHHDPQAAARHPGQRPPAPSPRRRPQPPPPHQPATHPHQWHLDPRSHRSLTPTHADPPTKIVRTLLAPVRSCGRRG